MFPSSLHGTFAIVGDLHMRITPILIHEESETLTTMILTQGSSTSPFLLKWSEGVSRVNLL